MNILYSPGAWESFFLAITGAGSALCGLVFVGLSLNLSKIIPFPRLVGRGAEAVALLLATVIFSLMCLIPEASPKLIGILLFATGLPLWFMVTRLHIFAYHEQKEKYLYSFIRRAVIAQLAMVPVIISAVSLFLGAGGGLAWLAFGLVMAVVVGVYDAWVLVIEILR